LRQIGIARDHGFSTAAPGRGRAGANPGLYRGGGKRGFDLVVTLIAVPPGLLLIALAALLMRLSGDRGPVLFAQHRIGRDRRAFRCWKIRTMVPDADARLRALLASDPAAARDWKRDHKLREDPRVTPLGRLLRRSSLDELPQLWNVLRGDMSLVGPRPVVRSELRRYGVHGQGYASVRPGLTGLWQISGRNETSYAERVRLDLDYIRRMSLWLDLRVLLATVGAVLRSTGR
jgi:lipopolysaccharide/colanic/teichoic acid biosynthesis glycosyltransferase